METFASAEVCLRRGLPFCAVRIIHDSAADLLPPDVDWLLRQKTDAARLGAAFSAILRRPKSVKDLLALKEKSIIDAAQLAKFLARLIEP